MGKGLEGLSVRVLITRCHQNYNLKIVLTPLECPKAGADFGCVTS